MSGRFFCGRTLAGLDDFRIRGGLGGGPGGRHFFRGCGDARRFRFRELVLLAVLDVDDVGGDDPLRIAFALGLALIQPVRLVAELLDEIERMRDQQDRFVAPAELGELVETLVREALIADGKHFVHEQHFGIDVHGHGKAEAHIHAGRVGLHRRIDEVLHLGELDDLVEAAADVLLGEAQHDAVDENVLAAGNLRMEAGAQLDQRRDAAVDLDAALGGTRDAGHALEQRALAGSVAADHAVGAALRDGERHAAKRLERFVGLEIAEQAAVEDRRLQRGKLPLPRVAAVDLRDVDDVDGGRHTSSAKLSRRRSNTK